MKIRIENQFFLSGIVLIIFLFQIILIFPFIKTGTTIVKETKETEVPDNDGGYTNTLPSKKDATSKTEVFPVTPKGSFSIVVLPDTQKYAKYYPDIFCSQTDWIVENKNKLNIAFAMQLGDIVDSGAKDLREWEVASRCMKKLSGVIPWSVLPGNHDTDVASDKKTGLGTYDKYFGASLFKGFSWYKESYKNNQNSFIEIKAEGMKIGVINLSIEPENDILAWANKKIKDNPDLYFIVATHKYLEDSGKGRDVGLNFGPIGNDGEGIWQNLVKKNCNVELVLGGHFHMIDGEDSLVSKNDCGKDVMQTIQDYQRREMGGNGRLRVYTFTPSQKKVEVKTYSPYTKTFEVDEDSQFEFNFK